MERSKTASVSRGKESAVRSVLYGAWDGTKKLAESQRPEAWKERIMHTIEERIVPTLSPEKQYAYVQHRETVEQLAAVAGVGITTAEIAAVVAGVYGGKKLIDRLRVLAANGSYPDPVSPAMHQQDRDVMYRPNVPRKMAKKLPRIPVDVAAQKPADPLDAETLQEIAGALDRMYPRRPISYRRLGGKPVVTKLSQTLWKKKATAVFAGALQEMPDFPPEYINTKNETLNAVVRKMWFDPEGATKTYKFRFDEPAVRERMAYSMLREWFRVQGLSDAPLARTVLSLWEKTNFTGVPRLGTEEMAAFVGRHVQPEFLSDYTMQLLRGGSANNRVSHAIFTRLSHMFEKDAPVPLGDAQFARPVQHAFQRLFHRARMGGGKEVRAHMQLERAIAAMWLHRDDRVISRCLSDLAKEPAGKKQDELVRQILERIGGFRYRPADAWGLWQKHTPRKEAGHILSYWQQKKFTGLSDIVQGHTVSS